MTAQPLVWQLLELDMSFVMLRHVCFLFRSVIRPASDLFPFCFKHKPFDLHWMVGSFFKTLMVTHFTPHGWGKMGHSRNKKKGGLPPPWIRFLELIQQVRLEETRNALFRQKNQKKNWLANFYWILIPKSATFYPTLPYSTYQRLLCIA